MRACASRRSYETRQLVLGAATAHRAQVVERARVERRDVFGIEELSDAFHRRSRLPVGPSG